MRILYLIRHTVPRILPGICYGQLDLDVADSFDLEAKDILHWLPPMELIITSPLLRTRRLAEHLAQAQQCELRSDARLMEKHFGAWEGQAWDDVPRHEIDAWAANLLDYAPSGGESPQQLMQRVQTCWCDIAQLPQQHIALVAHGGSIRALLAQMAGISIIDTLKWEMGYGTVIGVRVG